MPLRETFSFRDPPPHPVDTRAFAPRRLKRTPVDGLRPSVETTALDEPQKVKMAARNGSGAEASGVTQFPHIIEVIEELETNALYS